MKGPRQRVQRQGTERQSQCTGRLDQQNMHQMTTNLPGSYTSFHSAMLTHAPQPAYSLHIARNLDVHATLASSQVLDELCACS